MLDISSICTASMEKLGYKSIYLLGTISMQLKSIHITAQHQ